MTASPHAEIYFYESLMEDTVFSSTILAECSPTPLKMSAMLILSGQQV